MENPIYKRSTLYHLFTHCLLSANHKPQNVLYKGEAILLKPGEFSTTIDKISEETGIKRTTAYDGLKTLSTLNLIRTKPERKLTIISVINWHTYQSKPNDNRIIAERWPNATRRKPLPSKGLRSREECKNVRNIYIVSKESLIAFLHTNVSIKVKEPLILFINKVRQANKSKQIAPVRVNNLVKELLHIG